MNVRSILIYGATLSTNVQAPAKFDEMLLSQYLKNLLHTSYPLPAKLIHQLCIRLRLPSFKMYVEKEAKIWILKLRKYATGKPGDKISQHARDTLNTIRKLPLGTALRDFAGMRSFNQKRWLLKPFREWNESTRTGNADTRELGNVTQLEASSDILDSIPLTEQEIVKRSAL